MTERQKTSAGERASKHALRTWKCPMCGKRVHGNGGRSSHKRAHVRKVGLRVEDYRSVHAAYCAARNLRPRVWCAGNRLHYMWQPRGCQGTVTVRVSRHRGRVWWVDLVRVGDRAERGRGYGTQAMKDVLRFLFGFLGAERVGLDAHPLGHDRNLDPWYRSLGFRPEGGALWAAEAP